MAMKMLAAKTNYLSSVSGTHIVDRDMTTACCLSSFTHAPWHEFICARTHRHTGTLNKFYKIIWCNQLYERGSRVTQANLKLGIRP